MTIEKIFMVATRNKMRFNYRGVLSVEDLWDLSLESLDAIFKGLNSQLKKSNEESLLGVKTQEDKDVELKIEIVKYIVNVKLEERENRLKAKANKEQKDKILEILANKQDEDLHNKSQDELIKMLEELEK